MPALTAGLWSAEYTHTHTHTQTQTHTQTPACTQPYLCVSASGEVPVDCCPGVTDRELPCQRVKSYLVKDASTGCHLDATVYITRRGKQLCVPHPTQRHWVRACITAVDARAARH
ncbi:unnamed protein product [Boreogadus saida]